MPFIEKNLEAGATVSFFPVDLRNRQRLKPMIEGLEE